MIGLGSLVAGAVVLTLRAEVLVYLVGGWSVPALLPLAGTLAAFGVYRLAEFERTRSPI